MKLEVREIASALVGSSESMTDFRAPSQEGVISLSQRIPFREALEEMHLNDGSKISPDRGPDAVVNATSTVVALAATRAPLPVDRLASVGLR
jgi:hypothetical protein